MRGQIELIDTDGDSGRILGDDGLSYNFDPSKLSADTPLVDGLKVEFEAQGKLVTSIQIADENSFAVKKLPGSGWWIAGYVGLWTMTLLFILEGGTSKNPTNFMMATAFAAVLFLCRYIYYVFEILNRHGGSPNAILAIVLCWIPYLNYLWIPFLFGAWKSEFNSLNAKNEWRLPEMPTWVTITAIVSFVIGVIAEAVPLTAHFPTVDRVVALIFPVTLGIYGHMCIRRAAMINY